MGRTLYRHAGLLRLMAVLLPAACCWALWQAIEFDPPSASAAPHTITPVKHPFDPDWPEVSRLLAIKCAACHRPGSERVDLTRYESLVCDLPEMGGPLVVPGAPHESMLWWQVVWNHEGHPDSPESPVPAMPPDPEEWLTAGQLATIERWIANGARKYRPNADPKADPGMRPLMETDFPSARECKTCHPKQYEEWSRSMHAYAQHSPVFEAFNLTMQERTHGTVGTFCSRCHTPLGTAIGEGGNCRNVHRSQLSMEGITCVVCHRLPEPYYKANTRRYIQPGKLIEGCMYGPFEDPVALETGAHPARGSAHIRESAFCGACHDVTNPEGLRLEEAFSEWQNSPAAKNGVSCQECHMGPVQGAPIAADQRPLGRAAVVPGVDPECIPLRPLSDHTFAGPDYSLLPDTEFPHKLDWMYEVDYRNTECLTPYQRASLDRLRRKNRRQLEIARAKRYELLGRAAELTLKAPSTAAPGEKAMIRVDVTSKVAGHNFPTGFTEERQVWVELRVVDPAGRVVFASGDLDENGDLRDEHSHAVESGQLPYDQYLLNFQSKFIVTTFRGTERSVVIPANRHLAPLSILRPATGVPASFGRPAAARVAKGSLPPLATVGQDYPVQLSEASGEYRVTAKLNYRHLPPVLLDEIGVGHLKHLLEVVTIDQEEAVICVGTEAGAEGAGCR